MVHCDYELIESNRVLENRLKKNAVKTRKLQTNGGVKSEILSLSFGILGFNYFYRKLDDIPVQNNALRKGLRIVIPAFIGYKLAIIVFRGCIVNFGNYNDYIYMNSNSKLTTLLMNHANHSDNLGTEKTDLRQSITQYKI